ERGGGGAGGCEMGGADEGADRGAAESSGERRVEERPGNPTEVAPTALAKRQQESRVGDPRQHAVESAEPRIRAVGAVFEDARDQHDAERDDRDREEAGAWRTFVEQRPC